MDPNNQAPVDENAPVDQPESTPTTDPTEGGEGVTEDPTLGTGTTAGDGDVTGNVDAPDVDENEGDTV